MPQTPTPTKPPRRPRRLAPTRVLSTRQGSMFVALVTALLAGGLLLAFLNSYRHSSEGTSASATVLVAKSVIEKGTTGEVIATKGMFERRRVADEQIKDGAFTDASSLKGKVTKGEVLPDQQLTSS